MRLILALTECVFGRFTNMLACFASEILWVAAMDTWNHKLYGCSIKLCNPYPRKEVLSQPNISPFELSCRIVWIKPSTMPKVIFRLLWVDGWPHQFTGGME